MRRFEARDGAAVARLDSQERMVVARVVADVGLLLGGEVFGLEDPRPEPEGAEDVFAQLRGLEESLATPDDPAILRLLPHASDDREVADEFRRLTEQGLRDQKVRRLRRVWEQLSEEGPEWEVRADEAMETSSALNDVRLVIASRLGLMTDEDAEELHRQIQESSPQEGHPSGGAGSEVQPERLWLGMLYESLTWLQASLVAFVMEQEDADE